MIQILNKKRNGRLYMYKLAMSCVQGGVLVEASEEEIPEGRKDPAPTRSASVMLTPNDVAAVFDTPEFGHIRPVGMGTGELTEDQLYCWPHTSAAEAVDKIGITCFDMTVGQLDFVVTNGMLTLFVDSLRSMAASLMFPAMHREEGK